MHSSTLSTLPRLSVADIENACGARTYQRGLQYWRQGKVREAELVDFFDLPQISATVCGSNGRVYEVRIALLDDEQGQYEIDAECSCPVEFNCKHAVAALLQVLNHAHGGLEVRSEDPVAGWLGALKTASRADPGPEDEPLPKDVAFRLIYVLEPHALPRNPHGLRVSTHRVRLLKKGGYGKPSVFSLERAVEGYAAYNFIRRCDRDIAQLLIERTPLYYYDHSHSYALRRELGELALRRMLASGRCHWREQDTPALNPAPPRELRFQWEAMEDGRRLEAHLQPPAQHIVRIEGFWYVDLERLEVGRLVHPHLSPEQVTSLLQAPVIPDHRLEELSRQLLTEAAEYELPLPAELDIERIRIEGEAPVPHLLLHSREELSENREPRRFHCARLRFGYGPVRLDEAGTQTLVQGDKRLYHVQRDPQAEQAAMEGLSALGLRLNQAGDRRYLDWIIPAGTIADSAWRWHEFLEHGLPRLREQGWQVEIDASFHLIFQEPDDWHGELEEQGNDWFALTLGVDLDGERVNLLPLLVGLLAQAGDPAQLRARLQAQSHILMPMGEHRWLKIPSVRLLAIFDTLVELYDHEPLDSGGRLMLARSQGAQLGDLLNDPQLHWAGAEELRRLGERLRRFEGIHPAATPPGFQAQLRPYQSQGLGWLGFLREFGFHGVLADDMGLGKTVQTLAHLLAERQQARAVRPNLIIAPTSLMGNWRREAAQFAPKLRVLVLHGAERHRHFPRIADHDLVLTTYPLLRRDRDRLLEHSFHYIVLDEAQSVKNPKSQTTQIVYQLQGDHRLCLTGTPLENHLGELWSMFHFLMPGYLGGLQRFNRLFRIPIERHGDDARHDALRRRLRPFLLRRSKAEVASELPEKTEIVRTVSLQGAQRDLYETIRLAMDKKLRREIGNKGLARSHIMILDALLKLRQVCCDPRLLSLPQAKKVKRSAKLELLMDLLPEMIEEGRKILLFSQFTRMLGLIETELQGLGIDYAKLTGQTRRRDEAIARFQQGEVPVFLISLKAGGVGLNLTAADTVIHYDPWWNPAVENQATDRAHRIGQDKAVFVYKLITEQTVEDKIIALQQQKQALAEAIYSGTEPGARLTAEDLQTLLRPLDP
jgi:superfamily II DNA or RNA helicase